MKSWCLWIAHIKEESVNMIFIDSIWIIKGFRNHNMIFKQANSYVILLNDDKKYDKW